MHSSETRESFDIEGYAIFRNVLDANLLHELRAHVEWLQARNPGVRPEKLPHLQDDPFWCRVAADPRLLDIAEQFVGPDIALFASSYFLKGAGDGLPVLWHQDGSYWPLDPASDVVTLWLAVDDSTPENGCLRVIPRSHRAGYHRHGWSDDQDNVLSSEIAVDRVAEDEAVDIVLKAGDVSVHHPQIIHGSLANRSPNRRCGLTLRYIPTSTRVVEDRWLHGLPDKPGSASRRSLHDSVPTFLLRGEARSGINTYRPLPKFDPARHMRFEGWELWT